MIEATISMIAPPMATMIAGSSNLSATVEAASNSSSSCTAALSRSAGTVPARSPAATM